MEELRSENSSRVALCEEPRGQFQPRCWMQQEQPITSSFGVIRRAQSWEVVSGGSFSAQVGQQLRTGSAQGQGPFLQRGLCSLHVHHSQESTTESQNPTRVWVGRHLKSHLIPTSCQDTDTFHYPRLLRFTLLISCSLPSRIKIHHHSPACYKSRKKVLHTLNVYFLKRTLKPYTRKTLSKYCFEDWPVGQQ